MRTCLLSLLAGFLLCANATAAITYDHQQARNMDDVHSLGVIYINHNGASESEAGQPLNVMTNMRDTGYASALLIQETESRLTGVNFYR